MKYPFYRLIILMAFMMPFAVRSQQVGIGQWRDHLPYDYATTVEEFNSLIYCSTPYSMFYLTGITTRSAGLARSTVCLTWA